MRASLKRRERLRGGRGVSARGSGGPCPRACGRRAMVSFRHRKDGVTGVKKMGNGEEFGEI